MTTVSDLKKGKPISGRLAETSCAALLSGHPVSLNKNAKIRYACEKYPTAAVYLIEEGDLLKGEYVVISDHIKLR